MTAREIAETLRTLLPEHTFKAVVKRAAAMDSETKRQAMLAGVLEERRRSESQ